MTTKKEAWRSRLEAIVQRQVEKTGQAAAEVVSKRSKRKAEVLKAHPEFEEPNATTYRQVLMTEKNIGARAKPKRRSDGTPNWFFVQEWFIDGIYRNNRKWFVVEPGKDWNATSQTLWVWAEKNCAERLLAHYGEEIVKKTVAWFCDNWQGIIDQSHGRLGGAPNIKMLWAMRDKYFVEASEGKVYERAKSIKDAKAERRKKKKHMVGEHDPDAEAKMPLVGWGDV